MSESLIERAVKQHGADEIFGRLSPEQRALIKYDWRLWARPEQLPPHGNWLVWLMLAGRGGGKTRAGAEWIQRFAMEHPGCRIALIARTAADIRNTMVEGPSGLLNIARPDQMPEHQPGRSMLSWPNGSIALTFSAEEPKGLRGPQFHAAWCDELAAWRTRPDEDDKPGIPSAWTQLEYGIRLPGSRPQVVVTTTPRATPIIRQLLKDPQTVVTRWSTFDNAANLAPEFVSRIRDRYDGTRLGRQELYAEVLADIEGALWKRDAFDDKRIAVNAVPQLRRVVVAVDPSGSSKQEADEAGIVVAGVGPCGCKGRPEQHLFVLADKSGRFSPRDVAARAVRAYHEFHADRLVAEDNFGGQIIQDLVELVAPEVAQAEIEAAKREGREARRLPNQVAYRRVHASRGKTVRAEPVAALYEQGRVHHVGVFERLEEECCTYTAQSTESPGRMDALVWAAFDLIVAEAGRSMGGVLPISIDR